MPSARTHATPVGVSLARFLFHMYTKSKKNIQVLLIIYMCAFAVHSQFLFLASIAALSTQSTGFQHFRL